MASQRTTVLAHPLASGIRAGIAYGATVFGIGFLLGTARVLLLAPRVGATLAVSIETPVILAASWYVAAFWMKRLAVSTRLRTRMLAGAVAFVTLMGLEIALSVSLFHRSVGEYLAGLRSPAGGIGLAAQVCFATFPFFHAVIRSASPHHSNQH